jgi:serine/threonine protein kinase/peptidoglycan hydrolase-like protein with peptidoglycan-binding domain
VPDVEEGGGGIRHDMRGVLPAGTTLRGYELKSILGQGAFGITYRARDITLDRDVAIKEYLPTSLALREDRTTVVPRSADHAEQFAWGRERFLEEARTLARLDRTPAIVRVHDFLEDNGTAYMVMALIEGETLNKRLMREQRLAPEMIERVLFPLLDGLAEVHAAGFLHRDIKPANIMLDTNGRPTLIDFGAARAAMAGRSTTMTAIFTPGYAAAEQFTSAKQGPWTDIYGLAATLYHAITGQIPPSAVERILADTYRPLSDLRPPGYAPTLLDGIDAGLAVRAEDRPQSVAEWGHMLRAGESLSFQEATRVARKPSRLTRAANRSRNARVTIRGPALWATAVAAILVLAGASYLAYQANAPGAVGTAALSLSAKQLEQALAERRKADALAAEKRRLEDEARTRVANEAAAKRQAEVELEQARRARQKAEDELASLKADIEARRQADARQPMQAEAVQRRAAEEEVKRKAEAEAASLRQAEEEAAKTAAADAKSKRQADEALARAEADRQSADAEARTKAEAETKAKEEAEAAERGLRLEGTDRERLQVALTSLGFDTRGSDGLFGPRSREMIVAWQKKAGAPATGFLTTAQYQALLREAAPALSKHNEQKKAEEEAKAQTTAASVPGPSQPSVAGAASSGTAGLANGTYHGGFSFQVNAVTAVVALAIEVTDGIGAGTATSSPCGASPVSLNVSASGNVTGQLKVSLGSTCEPTPFQITGRVDGGKLLIMLAQVDGFLRAPATLALSAASPATAAAGSRASPFDGLFAGTIRVLGELRPVTVQIVDGTGSGRTDNPRCGPMAIKFTVSPSGAIAGIYDGYSPDNCRPEIWTVKGRVEDQRLIMELANSRTVMRSSGVLKRKDEETKGQGESAAAAADGSATAVPSATPIAAQPTTTAYDGTYGGDADITPGFAGLGNRVTVSLRLTGGRGSGMLTSPGCSPSQFSVTISPTGNVAGEGHFNCIVGNGISGPLKISGMFQGKQPQLTLAADRGRLAVLLRPGGASSPALPSPDGPWRGTFSCPQGSGNKTTDSQAAFTLDLDVRLTNGSGTWKASGPGGNNGNTFEIRVAVDASAVTAVRFFIFKLSPGGQQTLSGEYDGNAIRATGMEPWSTGRPCTMTLTRGE